MKWTLENYRVRRYRLRRFVKTYYDTQKLYVLISNRIGLKGDGTAMNRETVLLEDEFAIYSVALESLTKMLESLEKRIKEELNEWPIYTEWLLGVKGVGWTMSAVICSEFDIVIAIYVSKMVQFSGLNPGMVRGMKAVKVKNPKTYKAKKGEEIVTRLKGKVIVRTFDMVRGDKLTAGYLAPFCQFLRSKLIGVLAPSFLRSQSEYAQLHYYRLHVPLKDRARMGVGRLDVSEKINEKTGKMWKDESEGYRSNYAKRIMIKEFEKDLYVAWRTLEDLPVRKPYSEEYLGKKPHNKKDKK